jgi:hypothetical protein
MSRAVLIGLYVAWPVIVGVVCASARIRRRFLLLSAAGWLGAVAVATNAQPPARALVVGLVFGVASSLGLWLATARGVTFTWMQNKTYWSESNPVPAGEKVAAALVAAMGVIGLAVGTLGA